jgi:murein DD-endopeptidase MepM/ murein hydrolase activator NlpD
MVIPERTRRVHRVVVPFFLIKLGVILLSLSSVFLLILCIDYIHVLGRMVENKRLKGENFKLRQELQLIRNKVDSMEYTVDRVRNYAKKLQILTGQGEKGEGGGELPLGAGPGEEDVPREPAAKERHSSNGPESAPLAPLGDRVSRLQTVSLNTEASLSRLQLYLYARGAIMAATPSLLPIHGWLSSPFGYRWHPIYGRYKRHTGIDIAAEPGTPVRAPADGFVIFSGQKEGYGKVVVIDHGYGIHTLFAHNAKLYINSGVRVKRGEMISEVGSTGHSTGPHLHYEVRKNGVPVNPLTFISRVHF